MYVLVVLLYGNCEIEEGASFHLVGSPGFHGAPCTTGSESSKTMHWWYIVWVYSLRSRF